MKSGLRQIFALVSAILSSIIMPAQDMPVLPDDPAILHGVLPNGMSYYLISNASSVGESDFVLVQRTGRNTVADSCDVDGSAAVSVARDALAYVPRSGSMSPQAFAVRHGAAPARIGFVDVSEEASIYRFNGLRVGNKREVLDSALLMMVDLAAYADAVGGKWYSPVDQAIVVSGDIDAKAVEEKLRMLSLMTPVKESVERKPYVWTPKESAVYVQESGISPDLAEISLTWSSPRVPREYMSTVQPMIFEQSLNILGMMAVHRVEGLLEERGIPYADVSYRHSGASFNPNDDELTITVILSEDEKEDGLSIMAEVMSSLDSRGASVSEYLRAEAEYADKLIFKVMRPLKEDSDYVERCISAFLYGSSLASDESRLDFHQSKVLPDTMRCRLFNDIAFALLDYSRNLTVRCPVDTAEARSLLDSVWLSAREPVNADMVSSNDTLRLPGSGPKVRVRSTKKEHVSGGVTWTFSNGFKVIYKQMQTGRRMYYTLALNEGYGNIRGLGTGEGAFMSDFPMLCRFSQMDADDFMGMLQTEGISMNTRVTLSNVLINGELPRDRIQLLLRALLSFVNERTLDEDAYSYYKEKEKLALKCAEGSYVSRMTAIDSTMCPDYRYSPYKSSKGLTSSFVKKSQDFFDRQSAKMNDGMLVLVGDMDPETLKKILLTYVGGFRTQDVTNRRPVVKYQPVSGWSTYTVKGKVNSVDVAMSTRMPLTVENNMAAAIASMVLEHRMSQVLDGSGMCMSLSYNCRIYPEERLNMMISVSEASEDGFAADMQRKDPISALAQVRSVLSDLSKTQITDEELNRYKKSLKHYLSIEMKDPRYWLDAIIVRYLDGKDMTTGYASKIDAVSADKVRSILASLDAGSKVEYVTKK